MSESESKKKTVMDVDAVIDRASVEVPKNSLEEIQMKAKEKKKEYNRNYYQKQKAKKSGEGLKVHWKNTVVSSVEEIPVQQSTDDYTLKRIVLGAVCTRTLGKDLVIEALGDKLMEIMERLQREDDI